MDQSHTRSNVSFAFDDVEQEGNDDPIASGCELSANQSADDETCLLSEDPRAFGGAAGRKCPKQHGVWCRVKALSLTRSGSERGMELDDQICFQDKKDGERASRLTRLKRLRIGPVRQDGSKHQLIKAERKLRRQADHQEIHIEQLNDVIKEQRAAAKMREKTVAELERKLCYTERRMVTSQRQTAKLNGLLELAKLQSDAQQQVADVKQNDVIKLAVKQAELYDQIRKLKLTIETLRTKLERCEMERSSNQNQSQDESAEHSANLHLPSSTAASRNLAGAANEARWAAGRHDNHSDAVQDEALNQAVNSRESARARGTNQRPQLRHSRLILIKRAFADANRRIKYQRAKITALRANVKTKDKRIQGLIDERDRISLVHERARHMAETKLEVLYKNLLSLPDALNTSTSPSNLQETTVTYMKEVDSATPAEEVERIISKLKEFGKFLGIDESFDDFMKNRGTQDTNSLSPTLETATQTVNNDVKHRENSTPLRILRRQKINRRILEKRCRAAQRKELSRSEPVEHVGRMDCRSLGKGGRQCRCCCYNAKIKKPTFLHEAHHVHEKTSLTTSASARSDVMAETTQGTEIKGGDTKEMVGSACPVLPEYTIPITEEGMIGRQHLEFSDDGDREECPQAPADEGMGSNVTDDIPKDVSPVTSVGNGQPEEDSPQDQGDPLGLTACRAKVTLDQRTEDDLEKKNDLIKRVSDLLVDKWCLEGQVKALVDNERALTVAKSEISCQLGAAHPQLERSTSDIGRLQLSHNALAVEEKIGRLQKLVKQMEERNNDDQATKSQLQYELASCKNKVVDLEAAKKRLEGEVEGWMETVMEVRRGRINLLNHMDDITDKVGKLHPNKSYTGNKEDPTASNRRGNNFSSKETCPCASHDVMRVNELKADIETLTEQRKIQDFQIEQLSDLLQKANDQKQQLMNHLAEVQQERSNLQLEFDLLLAHE